MDSDSDWEPPPKKKRKLNDNKSSKRKKRKNQRLNTTKSQRKTKRKKRSTKNKINDYYTPDNNTRNTNNPRSNYRNDNDNENGIEILWNDDEYFPSKSTKNKSNDNKTKKTNDKKNTKSTKQSKLKLKALSCAVNTISNLDTLICGYYRSLSSNHKELNNLNIIPTDITDLIFKYEKNILYIQINFVWTHKHFCCYHYQNCQILKNNRGQYIFERDTDNIYDSNAIKIITYNGDQIGHIPRDIASILAPLLDEGKIDLSSVGGVKGKPCIECVEIIPLNISENELKEIIHDILEDIPFDTNRYIHSNQ